MEADRRAWLAEIAVGKDRCRDAPSDSIRVYALIQTADQGSLWRSDDGGENWHVVSHDRRLIGLGITSAWPFLPQTRTKCSLPTARSFIRPTAAIRFTKVSWGGDTHDIWIDPKNPDRFVITDNAGMNITPVHGRGFDYVPLPIGQMYHVAA